MEKIYIFGHKKPDTDSVTSSISLSYLKNQLGFNTEPRVLGDINNETKFVLNYFNIKEPKYLNDVKLQIKDVNYHCDYYILETNSIKDAYDYMSEKGITGIPIVDKNRKFVNLVTLKIIVKNLISGNFYNLNTSYKNIVNTIEGEEVLKFDEEINGSVKVASYRSTTFMNNVDLTQNDILIVGDRHSIIEYAVNNKIKLLIISGNGYIKEEHLEIAKKNNVNIIRTKLDTFTVAKTINLSNYIYTLTEGIEPYTFDYNDYYDDFIDKSYKLKHNNYPVIDKNGICYGLIRITDIDDKSKKKVILVDHNELEQSADGIEEAEILEIIDHHKIGNFTSILPINFRNMPVGSTNTIIFQLFKENNIEISKEIAGLMISGILSDTLIFKSPTTTDYDKIAVESLSKIANIDYQKYGIEMLKAGSSIKGKTMEEIIYTDFKNFNVNNKKIAVCQIFTVDPEDIKKEEENYIQLLNNIAKNNDYSMVCFLVTDIIKNGSYFYFNDSAKSILDNCFNIEPFNQGQYIDGCVSRKKQVIPPIVDFMDKN
jgi:manganese-dependent inorganic pyrophosphatase